MLNFTHGARSQHSNGLAERMVAVVEEILRTRINYKQDDWESLVKACFWSSTAQHGRVRDEAEFLWSCSQIFSLQLSLHPWRIPAAETS